MLTTLNSLKCPPANSIYMFTLSVPISTNCQLFYKNLHTHLEYIFSAFVIEFQNYIYLSGPIAPLSWPGLLVESPNLRFAILATQFMSILQGQVLNSWLIIIGFHSMFVVVRGIRSSNRSGIPIFIALAPISSPLSLGLPSLSGKD